MVGLSGMATLDVLSRDGATGGLLAACQAGDRTALEHLFSRQAPRVYRWAVLMGLSAHDAEDVAQEALAIAARRIGDCQVEAALGSWLFQITRRVVANTRRSAWVRRVFRREAVDDEAPAFEETAPGDAEQELAVRRCFRRLTRGQAEVLLLFEVEGCTRAEVAQMLGVAEGTAASRLRLAREAFRKAWDAEAQDGRR